MAQADATLIAHRIRDTRQTMGWTLAQLAEQVADQDVGLSVGQLSRVEIGKRDLSVPELLAICGAFGVDVSTLTRPGRLCGTCGQEVPDGDR